MKCKNDGKGKKELITSTIVTIVIQYKQDQQDL